MIKRLLKFTLLMLSANLDGLRYILFEDMDILVISFECSNVLSKKEQKQVEEVQTLESLFKKESDN